jgi:hypothetical protein
MKVICRVHFAFKKEATSVVVNFAFMKRVDFSSGLMTRTPVPSPSIFRSACPVESMIQDGPKDTI